MTREIPGPHKIALTVVLALVMSALNAYVYMRFWHWFLVPIGAPAISYEHVFGIASMVSQVTYHVGDVPVHARKSLRDAISDSLSATAVLYVVVLPVGYILSGGVR